MSNDDSSKYLSDLERFKVDLDQHVATIFIDSPPVNAQDLLFCREIVRIFDFLGALDEVRVIILTASGTVFCAGADLSGRGRGVVEPGAVSHNNRLIRQAFDAVIECTKPVICALNGAAVGAGCIYALVSDILIAAEESFVSMTEVDYGFAGGVRHVLRSFSPSDARMVIYTGKRISGTELLRMNVASSCVPRERVLAEAQAIAAVIASKAPLAVLAAKRAFGLTEEMGLRDGYRYEQTQTALLMQTEDTKEALAAFVEKRKPVFRGR